MLKNLIVWAKEFRLLFLLFVVLPVTLGAVIAYKYDPEGFSWFYFALTIAAILLLHAGTIALNDYFDYKSGNDTVNTNRTKYSGGTGLVPDVLSPSTVFAAGILCFVLCVAIGLYIVFTRSFILLPIGITGVGIGYFYSAPPLKLAYRFLGELSWFGSMILMGLGAFFVQVPVNSFAELSLSFGSIETIIVASLPLAFMGTVGIYVLEFPDYNADQIAHKWNFMTIFGRKYGLPIFLSPERAVVHILDRGHIDRADPMGSEFRADHDTAGDLCIARADALPWRSKKYRAIHRDGHYRLRHYWRDHDPLFPVVSNEIVESHIFLYRVMCYHGQRAGALSKWTIRATLES